ncbi:MAG TPA: glycosyltransferase family 4 protein [Pyrinomonadaceae bacterium]|nr:glycosyltransferase family 4 protein [Pyrinomonadaceae bacterium]
MKVLALASYPIEAAATRFRLQQFVEPLAARGITLSIHSFLDSQQFKQLYRQKSWPRTALGLIMSSLRRLRDLEAARQADVILIQREAMMFGPPIIEWLGARVMKRPMVLDLDDATYVSYTSPTYGGLGSVLKWFSKTDDLIRWANIVTCGNRGIAEYVSGKGTEARVIPTVVDTDLFRPGSGAFARNAVVLGWIGTHSTFPYLESIFPVLADLARSHKFRLKVVGAGKESISVPGVEVENSAWAIDREVEDFRSIDIGLYPIDASLYSGWAAGKSGFKAVQYMAVGVPYVATPVGGSAEIGEEGTTHLFATTREEWHQALNNLLANAERRQQMGAAGRRHVMEHYGLEAQADKLANALREAGDRK